VLFFIIKTKKGGFYCLPKRGNDKNYSFWKEEQVHYHLDWSLEFIAVLAIESSQRT
jgi:hypothetical protein